MISQTGEYALRAVVCLASEPAGRLTTAQMADRTQVPGGYLSKVLQELVRAGVIESRRGKGGGFRLPRPAGEITILQVLNAVDPIQRIRTCPLGLPAHRDRLCALHSRLDGAMAAVEADFAAATVAELVDQAEPPAPVRPLLERLPIGLGVPPSAGFDQPLQLLSDCHSATSPAWRRSTPTTKRFPSSRACAPPSSSASHRSWPGSRPSRPTTTAPTPHMPSWASWAAGGSPTTGSTPGRTAVSPTSSPACAAPIAGTSGSRTRRSSPPPAACSPPPRSTRSGARWPTGAARSPARSARRSRPRPAEPPEIPMQTQPLPSVPIAPETMLPDLLRRHPQCRPVFDRYGLAGCGGPLGPMETIRYFARAHGIDETALLAELRTAAAGSGPALVVLPGLADTIYRRYFLGAIAVVLTAGATWGAVLLWRIGVHHDFTSLSVHAVNAHGHAQIFGWMGLFIMGFAYQAFPRIWHTPLAAPRLAPLVFALMLGGLTLHVAGMALTGLWPGALPVALLGGAAELVAIALFAGQILATWRAARRPLEPYVAFVVAGLACFLVQAAMGLWHGYHTMAARDESELLWYVSAWQAPLRDVQIHGLALFMIGGVSLRMLPGLFGLPPASARRCWTAFGLLSLALPVEVLSFPALRATGNPVFALTLYGSWILLTAGCLVLALPFKLWRPFPDSDRSAKFVRVAWAWLAVSLAMLLAYPLYMAASGTPFSHAYYGAVRHAVTVGFISLMILGMGAKVAATLNGLDTRRLSPLWGPFVLLNLGCFLRVTLQVLTDWQPAAYSSIGLSGMLEVTALAWWGAHVAGMILRGCNAWEPARAPKPRPERIMSDHIVADVVDWYPQTLAVFVAHGFGPLRNPVLRNTVARHTTIARAARLHRVDEAALLAELNGVVAGDSR
ncbi:MAG: Rrf2 family transcriptional regulator [Armatimonadetes bacterium]|nr:Rrf2 family transcriptional regulator [Armatimonadota bacterium]